MGNCLIRNSQVSAHDDYYDYDEENKVDKKPSESEVNDQQKKKEDVKEPGDIKIMPEESMKKKEKEKKKVRFELEKDEEGGKRRSGCVRIKLVVTQEEFRRILMRHENGTQQQKITLEQLLNSVRSRGSGRRICEVVGEDIDNGSINGWRPTLESIPEDRISFSE